MFSLSTSIIITFISNTITIIIIIHFSHFLSVWNTISFKRFDFFHIAGWQDLRFKGRRVWSQRTWWRNFQDEGTCHVWGPALETSIVNYILTYRYNMIAVILYSVIALNFRIILIGTINSKKYSCKMPTNPSFSSMVKNDLNMFKSFRIS